MKTTCSRYIYLSLLLLIAHQPVFASDPRPKLPPAPVWESSVTSQQLKEMPGYIERQHEQSLEAVESILRQFRPAYPEPRDRHLAMLMLDETLHYDKPNSNESAAIRQFEKMRYEVAAGEMENTRVTDGLLIWKLYNHGFVVRTKSVSVAFDLTRGYWGRDGGYPDFDNLTKRIIDQSDVLFISHTHGDHVDEWVIDTFLSQGKPVIVPPDFRPDDKRPIKLTRDGITKHTVKLKTGKTIDVVMFPGLQGDWVNNVPLVFTPEGMSIVHTGDLFRSNSTPKGALDWVNGVKDKWKTDVLLVNVWLNDLDKAISGFNPSLIITGHENELGHDPLKRKANFYAYDRFRDYKKPWVLMTWGESYYMPANK